MTPPIRYGTRKPLIGFPFSARREQAVGSVLWWALETEIQKLPLRVYRLVATAAGEELRSASGQALSRQDPAKPIPDGWILQKAGCYHGAVFTELAAEQGGMAP
jgi:hypothetical protein